MVGGLIQLAVYGNEDIYLTGNPQITYFKSIYRRHTNFSMENLRVQFIGDRGHLDYSFTTPKKITATLDINGDLIGNTYLVMKIPNIFTFEDVNGTITDTYRFRWIKNLGFNMIKSISAIVGGREIAKHSGEWLHIINSLTLSSERKKILNKMTGNIPELYDPRDSLGSYPDKLTTGNTPPSIRGRLIYIPLNFWFNTTPGLSLPILALQYNEVEIVVELNSLDNLYVLECERTEPGVDDEGKSITITVGKAKFKPNLKNPSSKHHIKNFLVGSEASDLGWGLEPYLEVNYIYLDKSERKLFGELSHEYLIEQVVQTDFYGIKEDNFIAEMLLNHPTKYFVFVFKRSDSETRNDHNNYSNWFDEEKNPIIYNDLKHYEEWYDEVVDDEQYCLSSYSVAANPINRNNYKQYSKNIATQGIIKFNGMNRIQEKQDLYFSLLQKHQHSLESDNTGIMMYSFSIDPNLFEPSGTANLSGLNKLTFEFNLTDIPDYKVGMPHYDHELTIYQVKYNIFRVVNGMGYTVFNG